MPFIFYMIIYLDTETSGLFPGQICQLSYIMQSKNQVLAKNFFFNVNYVEYGAFKVHGFSVEKLKALSNGLDFSYHVNEIAQDFNSAELIVAHNISFDLAFLRKEFERANKTLFVKRELCSMKKTVGLCKLPKSNGTGYKYPKLSQLCDCLQLSEDNVKGETEKLFNTSAAFHDARFDTVAVFLAVNELMKNNEQFNLLKDYL